jgi:hypothetical protein
MTDRPPLFMLVTAALYNALTPGTTTVVHNPLGEDWNADTCTIGREVTLTHPYGTTAGLSGRIVGYEVVHVDDLAGGARDDVLYRYGTDALYLAAIRIELDPTPAERT